jgi:hypothetical protein
MINHLVRKFFDESVDEIFQGDSRHGVRNFIKNHENKNKCIDNLTREIKNLEYQGKFLQEIHMKGLVKDIVKMFSRNALALKEKELARVVPLDAFDHFENKNEFKQIK